eukprot:GILI01005676.1.p1 GENE.GILI01005676.1~~GILI01005676.1.p1  ORF type:complete len:898 (+),score=233.78 GILI01005676.1:261-2954(+)
MSSMFQGLLGGRKIYPDPSAMPSMMTPNPGSVASGVAAGGIDIGDGNKISPEVAALVVRQYLLPMFEGSSKGAGKKLQSALQKTKPPGAGVDPSASGSGWNTLLGSKLASLNAVNEGSIDLNKDSASISSMKPGGDGLYAELKLSDNLLQELQNTKQELNQARFKLEQGKKENKELLDQINEFKNRLAQAEAEVRLVQYQDSMHLRMLQAIDLEKTQLQQQMNELSSLFNTAETERRRLQTALHDERSKLEKMTSALAEMEHLQSLTKLENDVLCEQLKSFHDGMRLLQDMKNLEEKVKQTEVVCQIKVKQLYDAKCDIEKRFVELSREKEDTVSTCKELTTANEFLSSERERLTQNLTSTEQELKDELTKTYTDREHIRKERDKFERKVRELTDEKDKLKQKIKRFRARKKLFEPEQKVCKNCSKEFMEGENYNWSCRTHQSEFGGEMWWCCGKPGKDAPGCKYAKHESKDDDDDMDEDEKNKEEGERKKNSKVRCWSCNEIGHDSRDCPRDPNIRTNFPVDKELARIEKLRNQARSLQNTTNRGLGMLKLIHGKLGQTSFTDEDDADSQDFLDLLEMKSAGQRSELTKHLRRRSMNLNVSIEELKKDNLVTDDDLVSPRNLNPSDSHSTLFSTVRRASAAGSSLNLVSSSSLISSAPSSSFVTNGGNTSSSPSPMIVVGNGAGSTTILRGNSRTGTAPGPMTNFNMNSLLSPTVEASINARSRRASALLSMFDKRLTAVEKDARDALEDAVAKSASGASHSSKSDSSHNDIPPASSPSPPPASSTPSPTSSAGAGAGAGGLTVPGRSKTPPAPAVEPVNPLIISPATLAYQKISPLLFAPPKDKKSPALATVMESFGDGGASSSSTAASPMMEKKKKEQEDADVEAEIDRLLKET